MNTESSAYLLLVRETSPESYEALSQEEKRHCLEEWNGWVDGMATQGKLEAGHPLEDARRVVSGAHGGRVTDGPFTEAKELVGGYFLLTDTTLDEATAIARSCPLLPFGMTVEIREIAPACHLARSLGWETMREPETT
jgi:hypothetical protein